MCVKNMKKSKKREKKKEIKICCVSLDMKKLLENQRHSRTEDREKSNVSRKKIIVDISKIKNRKQ